MKRTIISENRANADFVRVQKAIISANSILTCAHGDAGHTQGCFFLGTFAATGVKYYGFISWSIRRHEDQVNAEFRTRAVFSIISWGAVS